MAGKEKKRTIMIMRIYLGAGRRVGIACLSSSGRVCLFHLSFSSMSQSKGANFRGLNLKFSGV